MFEKIKELKKTEKGNALIKLSLYSVFLILVIVLLMIGNRIEPNRKTLKKDNIDSKNESVLQKQDKLTYFEKQEKLYQKPFEFTYTVTNNDKKITYIGKNDLNKIEGIKETDEELIRYTIEEGIAYRIRLSSKEEISNIYEGLDERLFSFKNLFESLNSLEMKVEITDELKKYIYKDYDEYDITVTTNAQEITNIYIENSIITYDFKFTY